MQMMGTPYKPMLSVNAAEILFFTVELLERRVKQIPGDANTTVKSQMLLAARRTAVEYAFCALTHFRNNLQNKTVS